MGPPPTIVLDHMQGEVAPFVNLLLTRFRLQDEGCLYPSLRI
jgi:hypothetical protein